MAKGQQKDFRIKVIEAALQLAAEKGWDSVSLSDIARKSKTSLAGLHEFFEDKSDILAALERMIDRKVLENQGEPDPDISARDRLFEVLMERFDALNEYRTGLVPILNSFRRDPKQAIIGLPHLCRSMNWMLEAAGLDSQGWRGALRLAGITGIYIRTLWVWAADDSPDLGKTMAALDKNLGRAENLANTLGL